MLTNPPIPYIVLFWEPISHLLLLWFNAHLAYCLNTFLNVKAVLAAFNQEKEKAVIVKLQTMFQAPVFHFEELCFE